MASKSHAGTSIGSSQQLQARILGYGCATTWLQGPHSFVFFVVVIGDDQSRLYQESGTDVMRKQKPSLNMLSNESINNSNSIYQLVEAPANPNGQL